MKEKHLRMFRRIFAGTAILAILVPVRAQVSNPSTWSDFVKGNGNMLVVDSLRRQTLHQLSTDNWEYVTSGGAILPAGKTTLRIPLGGTVSFASFPTDGYKDVVIRFHYAGDTLIDKEDLSVRYLTHGKVNTETLYSPEVKPGKPNAWFNYKVYQIEDSPSSLEIYTSDPAPDSQGGFYLINSLSAYGQIPEYSFFSGAGNWNDTIRWSHLPPLRRRCALISGAATIDSSVECKTASLGGGGSLNIAKTGHFIVDKLFLHSADNPLVNFDKTLTSADFSLAVQGDLSVKEDVTLRYVFPEKGKWYFLSFPFDIYLKGIDNRFQLKDDHFAGGGDYLYAQIYDGDKRASTQKPTGNWKVFSLSVSSGNPLIFEKGKGYLIALDAAASDNVLTFSVEAKKLPAGFGKTALIPVDVASSADTNGDNNGWYLCGNPLPAPLKLSQIEPDPALDGNIYIYNGKDYTPYAIGSNYALPPLAAFFVKATTATELVIMSEPFTVNTVLLKSGFPLYSDLTEPTDVKTKLSQIRNRNEEILLKSNMLYLNDLPSAGKLKVIDVAGRLVYSCPVPYGSSVQSLPLRPGLYILLIDAGGYRTQHKCVLTQ